MRKVDSGNRSENVRSEEQVLASLLGGDHLRLLRMSRLNDFRSNFQANFAVMNSFNHM